MRVKICGLTTVEDALFAANAGADAIGLVFHDSSPRNVSLERAAEIAKALPPFVQTVGLFVNRESAFVEEVLSSVELSLLQFHGAESGEFCSSFGVPYIKSIAMKPGVDVSESIASHPCAKGFLLDAFKPGVAGGTGETFNWKDFPTGLPVNLILAGGLNPENVSEAISQCKPYAVDVSGGVESSPGCKSKDKINTFIKNAKSAK